MSNMTAQGVPLVGALDGSPSPRQTSSPSAAVLHTNVVQVHGQHTLDGVHSNGSEGEASGMSCKTKKACWAAHRALVMARTHLEQSRPSLPSGGVLTVQSIMQLQGARWQGSKLMADIVTKRRT